ncbi:hypothetical protein HUT06_15305 [Actinomadura sp. NAK00032]|uniref:Imm8 family immunity protein n=1 Tax=Actinomadura sp. NAK00032 TaxID=2742128 RepID=UPI001591C540|nr:Imm8 family immunity protein [Actinomadura sp. NAK00032]QKW35238.1 hypothetical protein HUT06_15305 [Actinomadura sp. NAK00032]
MNVKVRALISPDVDLDSFWPEDETDFSFLLQALVGPSDGIGEESLQFIVCTPKNVARRLVREQVVFGYSLILVDSPNIPPLLRTVTAAIERIEGATWSDMVRKLARLGVYEFDDI